MNLPNDESVGARCARLVRRASHLLTARRHGTASRGAPARSRSSSGSASAGLAYVAQVVLARLMGQFEYGVFAYTWVWFMVVRRRRDARLRRFAGALHRAAPRARRGGASARLPPLRAARHRSSRRSSFGGAAHRGCCRRRPLDRAAPMCMPMALMALSHALRLHAVVPRRRRAQLQLDDARALPVYILRHGLLLVFMAGGRGARLRADRRRPASSASS